MKKLFVYGLSVALVAGAASCKKSSKGKMANEWAVSSYEMTGSSKTENSGTTSTDTWTVTGTDVKETTVYTPQGGTASTSEITINENTYTIEKDGTWSSSRITVENTSDDLGGGVTSADVETVTTTTTGTWDFLGGVGEFKKNERVVFNTLTETTNWSNVNTYTFSGSTTTTNTSGSSTNSYADGESAMIFTVVESKKKELQLSAEGNDISSSSYTDASGTTAGTKYTDVASYKMTLTQK